MLDHSWLTDDQKAAFASASFTPDRVSVSQYLSPWLVSNTYNAAFFRRGEVIIIEDARVTACLMNQALDFIHRAICNTIAHYILAQKGLETWARVTNYYASYFSVHSLLCLQGRTITRLRLDKPQEVHFVPIDFRSHVFGVTHRHLGTRPHHEAPWKHFYGIYDRYAVSHAAFETVSRRAYVAEPTDESDQRNTLNYTPFVGFTEILDLARYREFSAGFSKYIAVLEARNTLPEFLDDLQGYATDPDYKYFARTLLKLALAGDIILSIREASHAIDIEWTNVIEKWKNFLGTLFPDPSACYLLKFIPLIGSSVN
jgi:hypothetical protein